MQEMLEKKVRSLGWEGTLEDSVVTDSSILAWRIPWTEEPGGLQSMELQRSDTTKVTVHTHMYTCAHTHAQEIFLWPFCKTVAPMVDFVDHNSNCNLRKNQDFGLKLLSYNGNRIMPSGLAYRVGHL